MILLLLATAALACPDDISANIAPLRAAGEESAYNCLAADDQALTLLLEESLKGDDPESHPERITRAMAVWRLQRLDLEVSAEEARAYNGSDVRLLTDAIKAHRGRRSPSPEHGAIFEKFDWYDPSPQYTDARLTEGDSANITMLLTPPDPEPEPVPGDGLTQANEQTRVKACSCSAGSASVSWLIALFGLLFYRFERRS